MQILHRRFYGLNFWPRESVGEDSSLTLSWPHFFDTWFMASFCGFVRASAKILRPRSHGLNFWPPERVGEAFFIDGLVVPPSPSVVLCSRASPLFGMRAAGPQLWLDFRAPEMINRSRWNHETATAGIDFSALQTLQGFSSGCQPQRGPTVAV